NYGSSSLFGTVPSANTELANLNTNDDVLQKIFSLKKGESSVPVVLSSNVLVFNCTGITEETVANADDLEDKLKNVNYSCAEETLMTSSKVDNNVWNAYFEYFTEYGKTSK
ncbi:MAG: hypothetical protein II932_09390, partial [Treponema sp.]|nr:hypothetical protein [Treponema sp.]